MENLKLFQLTSSSAWCSVISHTCSVFAVGVVALVVRIITVLMLFTSLGEIVSLLVAFLYVCFLLDFFFCFFLLCCISFFFRI